MSRTHLFRWTCLLALLAAVVSCRWGDQAGTRIALTPEQIRLEHINTIDSTTLSTLITPDSTATEQLEALSADAWMLIDDATGMVISQKYANEPRFMASLTKMMTCLLALENSNLEDTVCITEDVFVCRDSRVRLGEGYLLGDLLYEMMLQSDNDAAYALAKHVGGDTIRFCEMMNEKAAYLGMENTHFANPNGMPAPDNYSTVGDLTRLARYAMRDSLFAAIVGTTEKKVPMIDGRHMDCYNTNVLLSSYDGCIGIKTGFTRQAGYCLASAATREGRTLYCVLLNSRSMRTRFTESAVLLDYGFRVMKQL
ncbi:MAG: D-alanyl-D-alanine carboxypeptidase [Prevotella sp.]|nr:D-alanyl-D-alanine carboxypeptidase [Prevotella sp.]